MAFRTCASFSLALISGVFAFGCTADSFEAREAFGERAHAATDERGRRDRVAVEGRLHEQPQARPRRPGAGERSGRRLRSRTPRPSRVGASGSGLVGDASRPGPGRTARGERGSFAWEGPHGWVGAWYGALSRRPAPGTSTPSP